MLAKQGWRILTNPNSLVARVLKARYFPHDDIINSKKGSSPPYAWRSIHNSLEVLKKGTRQRLGNGRRIHIWEDKWLPTPTSYKVISPPANFEDFPMVSSLIDLDSRWWKAYLVRSLFLPFKASTILKISLSYNLLKERQPNLGRKQKGNLHCQKHILYCLQPCGHNWWRWKLILWLKITTLEEDLAFKNPAKAQGLYLKNLCEWPSYYAKSKAQRH